jgi:hypothetical protein
MIDIKKKLNRLVQVAGVVGLILAGLVGYTLWLYNSGWLCAL